MCLNPQLHNYWGKAYVGLRRLGQLTELEGEITPKEHLTSVQLQFAWLSQSSCTWKCEPQKSPLQLPR